MQKKMSFRGRVEDKKKRLSLKIQTTLKTEVWLSGRKYGDYQIS